MKTLTRLPLVCAVLAVATLTASAQISLIPSQQPDPETNRYTVEIFEKGGLAVEFPDDCIIDQVRIDSVAGPVVWEPQYCNDLPVLLAPLGMITAEWLPVDGAGVPLAAGLYWLRVSYKLVGTPGLLEAWTAITHAPESPVLRPEEQAIVGQRRKHHGQNPLAA